MLPVAPTSPLRPGARRVQARVFSRWAIPARVPPMLPASMAQRVWICASEGGLARLSGGWDFGSFVLERTGDQGHEECTELRMHNWLMCTPKSANGYDVRLQRTGRREDLSLLVFLSALLLCSSLGKNQPLAPAKCTKPASRAQGRTRWAIKRRVMLKRVVVPWPTG